MGGTHSQNGQHLPVGSPDVTRSEEKSVSPTCLPVSLCLLLLLPSLLTASFAFQCGLNL